MTGLIDGAIDRARMVVAILVCAILAGTATYISLPKEADPDIPIPFVAITVPLAGVTPEDAERLLVRPIEQEIQALEGLKTFNSTATEGAAHKVNKASGAAPAFIATIAIRRPKSAPNARPKGMVRPLFLTNPAQP
jgi:multidrug efflux pump subunit AcrB